MKRGQYVPLDVNLGEDDRVLDAGPLAELVYVRCLRLAGRFWEDDGFVSARQVERVLPDLTPIVELVGCHLGTEDPLAALVRVGLLRPDDDDPFRPGYRIRSWLDWNRSASEIRRDRDKDAARKRTTRAGSAVPKDAEKDPAGVHLESERTSGSVRAPEAVAVPEALAAALPAAAASLSELSAACGRAGLVVSWKLTPAEAAEVVDLVATRGVRALVDHAKRRHNPNDPAHSVKAWLADWRTLPALRLVEKPVDCGLHPSAGRRPDGECGACWTDRRVAGEVTG